MKSYKIGDDPKKNRATLKRYLRDHAEKFEMSDWAQLSGASDKKFDEFYDTDDPKVKMAIFEQCGTACCIAGAMGILAGGSVYGDDDSRLKFGIPGADIQHVGYWPAKLSNAYYDAKDEGDYTGMVKAAEKAIDHFAVK